MFSKLLCFLPSAQDPSDQRSDARNFLKKYQHSRNNSSSNNKHNSYTRFSQDVNADTLSVLLSFFSATDKVTTLCLVSKTWFQYCWLSMDTFIVERTWNESFTRFMINQVLLKHDCYKFVKRLLVLPQNGKTSFDSCIERLFFNVNQGDAVSASSSSTTIPSTYMFNNMEEIQVHVPLAAESLPYIAAKCPNLRSLRFSTFV